MKEQNVALSNKEVETIITALSIASETIWDYDAKLNSKIETLIEKFKTVNSILNQVGA